MTPDQAITTVVTYLNGQNLGIPVFKYESKPATYVGEYIAVNHLPFIRRDSLQINSINVNIHIPNLKTGSPDYARLEVLLSIIRPLFENILINGAWFEIEQESQPIEDTDQTHFKNLRITIYHNGRKKY